MKNTWSDFTKEEIKDLERRLLNLENYLEEVTNYLKLELLNKYVKSEEFQDAAAMERHAKRELKKRR